MLLHSASDIVELVVARLLKTEGPAAVMAGHFSLVQNHDGVLVPGISSDIDDVQVKQGVANHPYMGNFPVETWRSGIDVVQRLRAVGRDAKLLVLVNDWQFVPPVVSGTRHEARDNYFTQALLPPTFEKMLGEAGLDQAALVTDVRDRKPCMFWSESGLRSRYRRSPLRMKVPTGHACAEEWIPLLVHLNDMGFGGLAAFAPNSCRVPIVSGTESASEVLELVLKVTNVFPSQSTENFWENTWIE